jgi:capsular polysaccharide biosynthesis protein
MGIVFVIFYFDTSIKSADEIENKLGLPVIGIIPKVKMDHK